MYPSLHSSCLCFDDLTSFTRARGLEKCEGNWKWEGSWWEQIFSYGEHFFTLHTPLSHVIEITFRWSHVKFKEDISLLTSEGQIFIFVEVFFKQNNETHWLSECVFHGFKRQFGKYIWVIKKCWLQDILMVCGSLINSLEYLKLA